ncbi:hypothetical protein V2A84_00110 [Yersinia sp. 2553 StPb PI]|uniref:hypothetical protein n=1 Tax=Yersinia sp. 2553 StPb PI TaxID=3117411 RepID=UPI003FA4CDBC
MNIIILATISGVCFSVYLIAKKKVSITIGVWLIMFITFPGLLGTVSYKEAKKYSESSFYNADISNTIGVYCIDSKVFYKVKDSVHKTDYPLQQFNDNAFNGVFPTSLTCKDSVEFKPVFYDYTGKTLPYSRVIQLINDNVNTGFIPSTFKN